MPRIAILGGGIAGLAAAYELERHRKAGKPLDWYLYEASDRFGGTISTTRLGTPEGEYILEDGPDGWVTEKPWARELAGELGLSRDIIPCNEADKKTYILLNEQLVPLPDRMRLMVPENLSTLTESPLFTAEAQRAYAAELARSDELRRKIPAEDESVAAFVRRHFGHEVLTKVAAPLLSGVFGGDVERLSVRAVMPAFVQMEREHGSLIAAVQARARARGTSEPQPTFTSFRRGMGQLTEALLSALPPDRLQSGHRAAALRRSPQGGWAIRFTGSNAHACAIGFVPFDIVLLATPGDATRDLLAPVDREAAALLPEDASSAVLVTFCWPSEQAVHVHIPCGFGFLVPPPGSSEGAQLLAATFAHQKYPGRAPAGSKVIRTFFGGSSAEQLSAQPDATVREAALAQLRAIMGPLPEPDPALTTVRRWPRSLPQYEVGHLDRMGQLQQRISALGNLHLLGNSYHGVGVPDLIRDARAAARTLLASLN
ncbi:MAG TPA: protoporphyrinogen oxidase [Acidobacteriaceae bacterium]|nr:protoporphyrinogen oxidase [Acidobacteriaceae bacterium]